jgi:hypothetical protein
MVKSVIFASSIAMGGAATVPLATFGASDDTLRTWRETNDPVMGGKSTGKFTVDSDNAIGTMEGTVAIVPSLSAPGFINVQALGTYADVSSCTGIELDIRVTSDPYDGWRFSFGNDRSACSQFFARGYHASFTPPSGNDFGKVQIPFNEFTRCWSDSTGEAIKTCADDSSVCPTTERLQNLQSLQVWAEGKVGDVKIDMKSVSAYGCDAAAAVAEPMTSVPLTTFDGAEETTQKWAAMNDPVMGGQSKATFNVAGNAGVLDGAVAIVPSLQAPGFCTMQSARVSFPDISGADAIQVVARQTSDYKGWRFTIGDAPHNPDSGAPFFVKGQYKANVAIPVSEEFQTIIIPFTDFTYKWSDTTGEPTVKCVDDASVCPDDEHLKAPKQLALTAEGVEGSFHLEVQSITAVNTASISAVLV